MSLSLLSFFFLALFHVPWQVLKLGEFPLLGFWVVWDFLFLYEFQGGLVSLIKGVCHHTQFLKWFYSFPHNLDLMLYYLAVCLDSLVRCLEEVLREQPFLAYFWSWEEALSFSVLSLTSDAANQRGHSFLVCCMFVVGSWTSPNAFTVYWDVSVVFTFPLFLLQIIQSLLMYLSVGRCFSSIEPVR